MLYFSCFLLQWIQVALKPPLRRLNASTTVRRGDHCQTIFSTIAMLRFLTSVVSGLTGETGMCTFRNLPVGAQRRLKTTVPLSSVCSSTVSQLTSLNKSLLMFLPVKICNNVCCFRFFVFISQFYCLQLRVKILY